jgi:hypothetical protein
MWSYSASPLGQVRRWEENFGKRIWVRVRCYWEHHWGTHGELEELPEEPPWKPENIIENRWEQTGNMIQIQEFKNSIPTPLPSILRSGFAWLNTYKL